MQRFASSDATLQLEWAATRAPIGEVEPGESFEVALPESSTGQLHARSRRGDLRRLDLHRVDAALGPISVRGCRPGDALEITIESIRTARWGWSGVFRHFGLLQDRFDDDLEVWRVGPRWATPLRGFLPRLRVPVHPMLGWIGVAPRKGRLGMIAPHSFGGNLDLRVNCVGTTLVLPVQVPGAKLSLGDPHAAQGDGEVCGTGIEVAARARLRVDVRRGAGPRYPRAMVRSPPPSAGPEFVTTGVGPNLLDGARAAVEGFLDAGPSFGLSPKAAYAVASVVGQLRIGEIVDAPNYVVVLGVPVSALPRSWRLGRARRRS